MFGSTSLQRGFGACIAALLISGCVSWPAIYGPGDFFQGSRKSETKAIAVVFVEGDIPDTQLAGARHLRPARLSLNTKRMIETKMLEGLRAKGYSPTNLGTFYTGVGIVNIFARVIKPDHENAERVAELKRMEAKRLELLAKAAEVGASSLLMVSYQVRRGLHREQKAGYGFTYEGSSLWAQIGWLSVDGQWLDYWHLPGGGNSVSIGDPDDKGKARAVELAEEVWTAGFPDYILKGIPPFQ